MYFTTLKTDKQGQHLKRWEATQFYERIKTDANNFLIGFLRDEAPAEQPQRYRRYKEIPHVYAAVELRKQTNGALGMAAFNGLVILEVRQLMSAKVCDATKRAGAAFQVPPVNAFGRALCITPDILRRRSKKGSEFYVKSI